jgi:hypothetical protein
MTTSQAYYDGLAQDQVKNCMSNLKLRNMMDENHSMKKRWDEVQTEKDIEDLIYFYMAKRRQWEGCVGASNAQDALDFIHANRDKKTHKLGEIYAKQR